MKKILLIPILALIPCLQLNTTINAQKVDKNNIIKQVTKSNSKENVEEFSLKVNKTISDYVSKFNNENVTYNKIQDIFSKDKEKYFKFVMSVMSNNINESNSILDSISKEIIKDSKNSDERLNNPYIPKDTRSEQYKNAYLEPTHKALRYSQNIQWSMIDEVFKNFKPKSITYDHQKYPDYNGYSTDFPYADGKGKPRGVIIHETANKSGNDTARGEVNAMRSSYGIDFEHTFVDANEIIEARPTDLGAWGAGPTANKYFIHIEMCEVNDINSFKQSLANTAFYASEMLKKYHLTPSFANGDKNNVQGSVWSHSLVSQLLGGSDHTDPDGYFAQWGFNFNSMYELIKKFYNLKQAELIDDNGLISLKYNDGHLAKGFTEYNGKFYNFDQNGIAQTGSINLFGKNLLFSNDGHQIKNEWYLENNNWQYYNGDGLISHGWVKVNNYWYYFDNNGNMRKGWFIENGKRYHLRDSGAMDTKWHKIGSRWYWFYSGGSQYVKIGWEKYHGKWMYSNGEAGYSTSEYLGRYYFDNNAYYKK